eukprot:366063-Chlamydomonas_euryale.AAC.15
MHACKTDKYKWGCPEQDMSERQWTVHHPKIHLLMVMSNDANQSRIINRSQARHSRAKLQTPHCNVQQADLATISRA